MKCETPARVSDSSLEPAPIQNPSAIERTPGTRSEMTRSPVLSSVSWCFDTPRDGIRASRPPSSEAYLAKPLDAAELLARVQPSLRRAVPVVGNGNGYS